MTSITIRIPEDRLEAGWLAFWRWLWSQGVNPFPHVRRCPCGCAEEICRCVRREPAVHKVEA